MRTVSVLFARKDSVYKTLPDVDVWDDERDARSWPGGNPVVAHPPCAQWSSFSHLAKVQADEKELGFFAVDQVRANGGVLEHPFNSKLWPSAGLPWPGAFDSVGGWTLYIELHWFGFPAKKPTWLYIVGVKPDDTPRIPFALGEAPAVVDTSKRPSKGRVVPKTWRDITPLDLATWLVETARKSQRG